MDGLPDYNTHTVDSRQQHPSLEYSANTDLFASLGRGALRYLSL